MDSRSRPSASAVCCLLLGCHILSSGKEFTGKPSPRIHEAGRERASLARSVLHRFQGLLVQMVRSGSSTIQVLALQSLHRRFAVGPRRSPPLRQHHCSLVCLPYHTLDLKRFDASLGDPAFQALWEALCILVALRAWKGWWRELRALVEVRTDSTAAMAALFKLSSPSDSLRRVACELALEEAESPFGILTVAHTPGIANKLPDELSRRFQPGKTWSTPSRLKHISESKIIDRDDNFWLFDSL